MCMSFGLDVIGHNPFLVKTDILVIISFHVKLDFSQKDCLIYEVSLLEYRLWTLKKNAKTMHA